MNFKSISLAVVLSITSFNLYAWGTQGHRIVGELAKNHLSKEILAKINELSDGDDLWVMSNWADEMRSNPNYKKTTPWHYVNIAKGDQYLSKKRSPEGDVIEALYRFEDILRDCKQDKKSRAEALRFIIHFMGDLHQPLHVSFEEDRGGNSIRVKWMFNESASLHSVWDEKLIDFEKLSYTEYTKYLNRYTEEEKKEMAKGNYVSWAHESHDLLPQIYDYNSDNKSTNSEQINLGYEYRYKVKPLLEKRLREGGYRLSVVLTKIFNNEKLTPEDIDLRKKIKDNI